MSRWTPEAQIETEWEADKWWGEPFGIVSFLYPTEVVEDNLVINRSFNVELELKVIVFPTETDTFSIGRGFSVSLEYQSKEPEDRESFLVSRSFVVVTKAVVVGVDIQESVSVQRDFVVEVVQNAISPLEQDAISVGRVFLVTVEAE